MLLSLAIKNFILVKELYLDLSKGLTVITGETGAGKSILLDAILFTLGGKFNNDIIRSGASSAQVTLEFTLTDSLKNVLTELEIAEDDSVIITRSQTSEGRKRFTINNHPVTVKVIEEVSDHLITMYGQHAYSGLLKISSHLAILDEFAGLGLQAKELVVLYRNWQNMEKELQLLEEKQESATRELDYLSFVAKELSSAKIVIGEEQELAEQRVKLQQQEKYLKLIQEVLALINSNEVSGSISQAQRLIIRGDKDENFASILHSIEQAELQLQEASNALEDKLASIGIELSLEEIEERLFFIRGLARKYNKAADELPIYLAEVEENLTQLQNFEINKDKLQKSAKAAKVNFQKLAEQLSITRKEAALKLETAVASELAPLKMAGCRFKAEFIKLAEDKWNINGCDQVRFVASTNPGMPFAAIDKVASGGELARFMLALQVALFQNSNQEVTIIFDEIDTGIGGSVADAVGQRLKKLASFCQVITITHQPQVAGKADSHILVAKTQDQNSTISSAHILSKSERLEEIARMISGQAITETSRMAARELME